jgi:WD40 repeat protein
MTRRRILDLLALATANVACTRRNTELQAKLADLERQGLLIMHPSLTAFTLSGAEAGKLTLPDTHEWVSVSPDGGWVAWVPRTDSLSSKEGAQIVLLGEVARSPRAVRFKGGSAANIAVSSKGERVALVVVDDASPARRLILLNSVTAEVDADVTQLVMGFRLADIERLHISADGNRLAIGSRYRFAVFDLRSGKVLLEGDGRFPSLSPDGKNLAVNEKQSTLAVYTLDTGFKRLLMKGWSVNGVGAWSPDGSLLLAGVWTSVAIVSRKLVAVEAVRDDFVEIMSLGEGDGGSRHVWVKRGLLQGESQRGARQN